MQAAIPKRLKKAVVSQYDSNDCGAACLLSILKFYGINENLEILKAVSGTTKNGTTLLGLQEAFLTYNIESGGYQAEIQDIKNLSKPAILHVVVGDIFNHYIVVYGYDGNGFQVIDPLYGFSLMDEFELIEIWKSKKLLLVENTDRLVQKKSEVNLYWFFELVKTHSDKLLNSLFLGSLITVLALSTALFTESIIDNYILKKLFLESIHLAIIWASLLLVNEMLTYLRTIIVNKQAFGFNVGLLNQYFFRLFRMNTRFFDSKETGDLISRMGDAGVLVETTTAIASQALIDVTIVIMISTYLFFMDTSLGFIVAGSTLLYLSIALQNSPKLMRLQRKLILAHSKRESTFIDVFTNIDVIKSYNAEHKFQKILSDRYMSFEQEQLALNKHVNVYSTSINLAQHFVLLSSFLFVTIGISNNEFAIGELFSTFILVSRFNGSMRSILILNVNLQASLVSISRLRDFSHLSDVASTNLPSPVSNKQFSGDYNFIYARGISLKHIGFEEIITEANFKAHQGFITCIYGRNGSGKSGFLKILKRMYEPLTGDIFLGSIPHTQYDMQEWNRQIVYIEQHPKIISGTVLENITMGKALSDTDAEKFLSRFSLTEFINALPDSINTQVGIGGIPLSGGQKQIISILRGLFHNPKVILLDEPTSSIDGQNKQIIIDILQKIKNDKIVIVTTHDDDLLNICDKVYSFEDKRMILSR
jgi:ATP-binding cassette subfamily B protein